MGLKEKITCLTATFAILTSCVTFDFNAYVIGGVTLNFILCSICTPTVTLIVSFKCYSYSDSLYNYRILTVGSIWLFSNGEIRGQFGSRPVNAVVANMSVAIRLASIEVSLDGFLVPGYTKVDFRQTFPWNKAPVESMLRESLEEGLPEPVLTVLDHFKEDFGWTQKMALAGRVSSVFLWLCCVTGVLSTVISMSQYMNVTPLAVSCSGCFLVCTCIVYSLILPQHPLVIQFPEGYLLFAKGWSYFVAAYLGVAEILLGIIAMVVFNIEKLNALLHKVAEAYHRRVASFSLKGIT